MVNWIAVEQLEAGDRPLGDCHLVNYRWVYQGSLGEGVPGCEDYTAEDFPKLSFPFAYTLSIYWSVTTVRPRAAAAVAPGAFCMLPDVIYHNSSDAQHGPCFCNGATACYS